MGFKFTLLGIEFTRNKEIEVEKEKASPSKNKLTSQQKRFKEAVDKCHKRTKKTQSFGDCMQKELK